MKKLFINARYFIAPLLILATLFGVIAGGPWVWTGVALLGVGIIIDTLHTRQTYGAGFDDNVKHFHLKVHYIEDTKKLIYDRKIQEGSGSSIYGLEVCRAMDLDPEFIKEANEIRKDLTNITNKILDTK